MEEIGGGNGGGDRRRKGWRRKKERVEEKDGKDGDRRTYDMFKDTPTSSVTSTSTRPLGNTFSLITVTSSPYRAAEISCVAASSCVHLVCHSLVPKRSCSRDTCLRDQPTFTQGWILNRRCSIAAE